MLGTGYFLKIEKINSRQEKQICPYRKNLFPQKFRVEEQYVWLIKALMQ